MNSDPTSLDRLHDIVLPASISWWPLAPGWYVLLGIVVLTVIWFVYRFWVRWQANAYRRQALQELAGMDDASAIAELLRRTALAVESRAEIAVKTGAGWADWLAGHCPDPMAPEVHQLLAAGVYSDPGKEENITILRDYASCWITRHHISSLHCKDKSGE